jgi:hypothetical protein
VLLSAKLATERIISDMATQPAYERGALRAEAGA